MGLVFHLSDFRAGTRMHDLRKITEWPQLATISSFIRKYAYVINPVTCVNKKASPAKRSTSTKYVAWITQEQPLAKQERAAWVSQLPDTPLTLSHKHRTKRPRRALVRRPAGAHAEPQPTGTQQPKRHWPQPGTFQPRHQRGQLRLRTPPARPATAQGLSTLQGVVPLRPGAQLTTARRPRLQLVLEERDRRLEGGALRDRTGTLAAIPIR